MSHQMKTMKIPVNPLLRDIHIRLLNALNRTDRRLSEDREDERERCTKDFDFLRKVNKHLEDENARLIAELGALTKGRGRR